MQAVPFAKIVIIRGYYYDLMLHTNFQENKKGKFYNLFVTTFPEK